MMKMSRLRLKEALAGYGFILPALILLTLFGFIPLFLAGYTSLYKYPLVNPARREFLGFANYVHAFQDETLRIAFVNTVYYALWQIPMQTLLALFLALLIQKPLKGIAFFRTGYSVTPGKHRENRYVYVRKAQDATPSPKSPRKTAQLRPRSTIKAGS